MLFMRRSRNGTLAKGPGVLHRYAWRRFVAVVHAVLWSLCFWYIAVVAAVLGRRERLPMPPLCPEAISRVLEVYWEHEPERPLSLDNVVLWLEVSFNALPPVCVPVSVA